MTDINLENTQIKPKQSILSSPIFQMLVTMAVFLLAAWIYVQKALLPRTFVTLSLLFVTISSWKQVVNSENYKALDIVVTFILDELLLIYSVLSISERNFEVGVKYWFLTPVLAILLMSYVPKIEGNREIVFSKTSGRIFRLLVATACPFLALLIPNVPQQTAYNYVMTFAYIVIVISFGYSIYCNYFHTKKAENQG